MPIIDILSITPLPPPYLVVEFPVADVAAATQWRDENAPGASIVTIQREIPDPPLA